MVRTAEEFAGVAAGIDGDARALMRAAVVEHTHDAVAVADHKHRLPADRRAVVIAGIGNLAVVADIDPGIGEQVLHFEIEHLPVDVDVAVDFGLPHEVMNRRGICPVMAHAVLL